MVATLRHLVVNNTQFKEIRCNKLYSQVYNPDSHVCNLKSHEYTWSTAKLWALQYQQIAFRSCTYLHFLAAVLTFTVLHCWLYSLDIKSAWKRVFVFIPTCIDSHKVGDLIHLELFQPHWYRNKKFTHDRWIKVCTFVYFSRTQKHTLSGQKKKKCVHKNV